MTMELILLVNGPLDGTIVQIPNKNPIMLYQKVRTVGGYDENGKYGSWYEYEYKRKESADMRVFEYKGIGYSTYKP